MNRDVENIQEVASRMGPAELAARLGFRVKGSNGRTRGVCPIHGGKNAESFSFDISREGAAVWKCHSSDCGGGDIFDLIGKLEGICNFKERLRRAADLLDVTLESDERPRREAPVVNLAAYREVKAACPRAYPPGVGDVWMNCPEGEFSSATAAYLSGRGYDLQILRDLDMVREIPDGARLPGWARIKGHSWLDAGYRLIMQAYDARGVVSSLRAWRTVKADDGLPKRLAPAGYSTGDLVTANGYGALLLSCPDQFVKCGEPINVKICEGEPSCLALAIAFHAMPANTVVFGALSATTWPEVVGRRIPKGSKVVCYPDADEVGKSLLEDVVITCGTHTEVLWVDISKVQVFR